MKPFEYLEHTADVKFRAYGKSPEEMLENAGAALFNAMIDTSQVRASKTWKVTLEAPDLEQLAYRWLSEIVFLFETESAVFSKFRVRLSQDREWTLEAEIEGETIDLDRHSFLSEVKAVTWHQFQVKKNSLWCLQAILDV
jgi:SHS2 domain-containing protein